MFNIPKNGWTEIKITDNNKTFCERASYLTDIPFEALKGIVFSLKNNVPFVQYFDAEGYEYTIVSNWFDTYIILSKDTDELIRFDINMYQLSKEILNDIQKNINEWVNFSYEDFTEKEIKIRKKELCEYCEKIKELINKIDKED